MLEQIGRYKVLTELGRGAMGVVYKAQDPTIGRMVAIKTIRLNDLAHPEEREQLRSRLFREAQSAGILSHPGIVTIYDIAEEASLAYIAMEFVEGQTLEKMLDMAAISDAKYVVSVATQTAIALDYAHSKGIIHRDIKPGNIMVNSEGMVKITDFGIARIASSKFTHTGTVMGTPSYMSPEQVRGAVVDGRSDMFSLAVVLYEMLTGQKPFSGDSITTVIFKIVSENPVPPKELNPSVGSKVNAVVMRALAKEPADRYQSCKEFAEGLQLAVAQTANLTPTIRKLPSLYAATEASDPAVATLADSRSEAPVAERAPAPSLQDLETVVSPLAPKPPAEPAAPAPLAVEETKVAEPPPAEKKLPPLEIKEAPEALRPLTPPIAEKRLPPLESKDPPPAAPVTAKQVLPQEIVPPALMVPEPSRGSRTGLVAALVVVVAVVAAAVIFWQRSQSPAAGPAESASQPAPTESAVPPLADKPSPVTPPPAAAPPSPAPQSAASSTPAPAASPVEKPPAPNLAASTPPASTIEAPPKAGAAGRVINITTTVPGARVVVDSKDDAACTTPCSVPVSNGRHTLLFTQTGFHAESRDVVVAGKPVDIQLTLRPIVGTVMLSTNPPGAAITVDGKPVEGETPLQLKLQPGSHVIAATKEGAGSAQQRVEVTDDALIPVRMTLSPQ